MRNELECRQEGGRLEISAAIPHHKYLDSVMRSKALLDIAGAFAGAHSPAKELTESYAALHHLRRFMHKDEPARVLHVGDGRMCRTGVMFAFYSSAENLSVDPDINRAAMGRWMHQVNARRVAFLERRIEDAMEEVQAFKPTHVTFVHAHVNPDWVLSRLTGVRAAVVIPCCFPSVQVSVVAELKQDWGILSPKRGVQVIDMQALTPRQFVDMHQHAMSAASSKGG